MRKVGDRVWYKGTIQFIVEVHKGKKTKEVNFQSGNLCTGFKSKPCSYTLSNGCRVTGDKIVRVHEKS